VRTCSRYEWRSLKLEATPRAIEKSPPGRIAARAGAFVDRQVTPQPMKEFWP
jgi:hypothetical protein